MNRYTGLLFPLFLLPLLLLSPATVTAEQEAHQEIFSRAADEPIEPKHVYALAQVLDEETQSLRYIMGTAKVNTTLFQIKNAAPREVYFQAVNLYSKIIRLHRNLTSRSSSDHDLPTVEQNIRPADVWAALAVALIQLDEIKDEYGINTHADFPEINEQGIPTDVYRSLLLTIRQMNQMLLEHPYTYSDVYQEISTALYCVLHIYNSFPGVPIQKMPEFEEGAKAEDVFAELRSTYQTIREIMLTSGLTILDLTTVPEPDIKAGDIYDLAVLLTSELKFLHFKAAVKKDIHDAAYPGIKFPSHVLQRLTYLHNHLRIILQKAQKNPDWLSDRQS